VFSERWLPRFLAIATAWWVALMAAGFPHARAAGQQPAASGSPSTDASSQRAVFSKYCFQCHNERVHTAGLALDKMDLSNVGVGAEVWEKVVRKLHASAMPPNGLPRPDKATADALISWLETELDRVAALSPNPGRTETFHRLNRAEYQNTIRDLLGLDVDVASLLPADDADTHGFDNIGALLSVSPALLERYLSAAAKVSHLVLAIPPPGPTSVTYTVSDLVVQDNQVSEDLPFGSRGGIAIHYVFPADGEYVVKIRLRRQLYDYIIGLGRPQELEVRLDGERVKTFTVGGEQRGTPGPVSFVGDVVGDAEWENYALNADSRLEVRFPVRAGPRILGVSFVRSFRAVDDDILQPPVSRGNLSRDDAPDGNQRIENVVISGPYEVDQSGASQTPSRHKILICEPTRSADEEACARKILSALVRRAYRRPATETETQRVLGFYKTARHDGSNFDAGLQLALERILVDPNFLFRVERDPENVAPNTVYRISDLALASRLSFFLWSSIPDDELLDLAVQGRLKDPAVLDRQVRRMIADPRSKALVTNFVGQWLLLRNLNGIVPDPDVFPDFDDNLREAMLRETELFVDSQLHEDRSVLDLLRANYTFVNERLARHYQIPNVYGDSFRRVTFGDNDPRGGLLGQASLMMVTSYPNRTSPVLRGKWVLDSLLGTPPPPPPPNVPALKERGADGKLTSVRARLEEHRKNPACATCHSQMDPLGFALENFDAIGKWRTRAEGGDPIDASGVLPGGAQFDGPAGLRNVLLGRREQFVGAMTEKLLAYALGRQVEYYDLPTVRKILRDSASGDYHWSSIITGIVKSTPFLMRNSRSEDSRTGAVTDAARH
jgi:mono/diheme cytochrome c family protein